MTPDELKSLEYFKDGERDIHGKPIDWTAADYQSMFWLCQVRRRLDSPIQIIRVTHPGKPTAIDWCCPGRKYSDVVMAVLRLPTCSYGFYSGNNLHTDLRQYDYLPARWLAIKKEERAHLADRGILGLAGNEANGWLYLAWDWRALQLVVELSERKAGVTVET